MTEYIVWREDENGAWGGPGVHSTARSAKAAIYEVATGHHSGGEGRYVAVPVRSWKPVTVKVETKTALRFS